MLKPNLIRTSLSSTSMLLSSDLEMFRDNVSSVFTAIMISKNDEIAAMLVYQTNPVGFELFFLV